MKGLDINTEQYFISPRLDISAQPHIQLTDTYSVYSHLRLQDKTVWSTNTNEAASFLRRREALRGQRRKVPEPAGTMTAITGSLDTKPHILVAMMSPDRRRQSQAAKSPPNVLKPAVMMITVNRGRSVSEATDAMAPTATTMSVGVATSREWSRDKP